MKGSDFCFEGLVQDFQGLVQDFTQRVYIYIQNYTCINYTYKTFSCPELNTKP